MLVNTGNILSPFHDEMNLTLVEQLTLPYDAEPIELAVGQVWSWPNSLRMVEIVYVGSLGVAFNNDGILDSCSVDGFSAYVRIPQPAVRPKRMVTTKLWVYGNFEGGAVVLRSENPDKYTFPAIGYIHGSEEETEVEDIGGKDE